MPHTLRAVLALTGLNMLLGGSVSALTLTESLELARQNNPQLLATRSGVASSAEQLKQAESGFYPDVDASANFSNVNREFSGGTESKSHPKRYGVTVTQDIFKGFGTLASARSARNTLKASEAELLIQEQTVFLAAVQAYIDVLRDIDVLKLNAYQVEVLGKQLKATKSRYDLGEVTQTDVQQAEARLAAAQAEMVDAEGNLVTSRATFEEVIGVEPDSLSWPVLDFALPDTAEDAMAKALSEHPRIMQALAVLAAQKYAVEGAKSNYYPTVSAQAALEKNIDASGGVNGDFDNRSISLNLSVPLFRGGENVSLVRQSIAERERAEQDYQNIRRAIKRELVDAHNAYRTALARQTALNNAVEANRLALRGVEKEAEVGSRTVLDVLDAREEYLSTQVDLTSAKRDSQVSAFRLKAAMGELTGVYLKNLLSAVAEDAVEEGAPDE